MDVRNLGDRVEEINAIDRIADPVHRAVTSLVPRGTIKDALHGVPLGHPVHPLLTDLPIGFWTSSFVLDLAGGRRGRRASDMLIALGVLSALPTAAAGLADWSELDRPQRRTGIVHAASNVVATALYTLSLVARARGRRGRGVVLAMAGATAATAGGYLGGHLSFRGGSGVNHATSAPSARDWTSLEVDGALADDKPTLAHLDGEPLAAVAERGREGSAHALYARCSHLGGPLDEGDVIDNCVRCPWHGSTFRMADGAVVHGPATATQPAYDVRVDAGGARARRRPTP